ncbi:MAG: hypothetical protein WCC66_13030 [Rhizobiaceae bacterium]
MREQLIQRTMGGVKVVDHLTRQTLRSGLRLVSQDLVFAPTASGAFQIAKAPGFAAYARSFDTVPAVAPRQFSFEVHDNTRRFLPIAANLTLPRDAAPDAAANRVDTPVVLELPSAGGRAAQAGWTVMRATVVRPDGTSIPGVLVRAMRAGTAEELGWGLTDLLGQALIPILGVPQLTEVQPDDDDNEPELTTAITNIRLELAVDANLPWPADPAALRAGGPSIRALSPPGDIALTAGAQAHRRLTMANL